MNFFTSKVFTPPGVWMRTPSPSRRPTRPRPIGEAIETHPFSPLLSSGATSLTTRSPPFSVSRRWTIEKPHAILGDGPRIDRREGGDPLLHKDDPCSDESLSLFHRVVIRILAEIPEE